MRKIIYSFGVILALSIASCTDFVDPTIPYNNFDTGVYLRTLVAPSPSFNFFALGASEFKVTVEAVDIEDGKLVRDVEVFVARRRVQTVTPEVKIGTIAAADFQPHTLTLPDVHPPSGSKYPAATFTIGIAAVLQAMGMTEADINGGDFFEFRLLLNTTDGRTFTNTNLSPDISGGLYYRSPFFYRIPVVCPSSLAGTYDLSTVGWCGNSYTGRARIVVDPIVNTSYILQVDLDGTFVDDFSLGSYRVCYGAATAPPGSAAGLRLNDACGQISFNTAGSSPWGDQFFLEEVTVAGSVLTLKVRSSWDTGGGVFEGGTATLTRTDGTNWPPLRL
ncbi:MAG: hypothetical protein KF852_06990 [Saprospiraceae bacterium]|nr:hypothetical protein [Saprospiraceae bacterium]